MSQHSDIDQRKIFGELGNNSTLLPTSGFTSAEK